MALAIGNNAVTGAYLGANQVRRAYKGGTLVYQGFGPASEQEFIQQTAAGGPAQLLKCFGKTIVDAGSLQSNKTSLLRAERVPIINIWDEEWELGRFTAEGVPSPSTTQIRTKNFISISSGSVYYFNIPNLAQGSYMGYAYWYDENKDFISRQACGPSQYNLCTAPANAIYLRFELRSEYGTTYNHDICINLSDPAINGTYYSHWRGSLALNLSTLTSGGVVVYPDGLRGVGTDRDEAYGSTGIVRMGRVDLGSLTWSYNASFTCFTAAYYDQQPKNNWAGICAPYTYVGHYSNRVDKSIFYIFLSQIGIMDTAYGTDPAAFKAAMSGVYLDYELATPLTYTLDTPLPTDLTCEQGDILQRVSDNNCPFVGEMKFGL